MRVICYSYYMSKQKKYLPFLAGALISFGVLFYLIYTVSPTFHLDFLTLSLPVTLFFFPLVALFIVCFFSFFLANIRRGILIAFFVTAVLLLRFFGFPNLYYIAILLAVTILLELALRR